MIKELISAPREFKRIGEEIKRVSKEIRDGVRDNGYCLDHICKEFKPAPKP
jgi:hypothetical protein